MFPLDLQIFRKLSEKSPNIFRKQFFTSCVKNIFPSFTTLQIFSENFETILVNIQFHFYPSSESIGQSELIRADDQTVRLEETRAA